MVRLDALHSCALIDELASQRRDGGEDDEWQMLSHAHDDIVDDNDAIDDIDAEFDDNDELEQALHRLSTATLPSTPLSPSSTTSTSTTTSTMTTKPKVQSAPLPSTSSTSSTGNSLKKYYASHKNKIIASLYNAYNNYSPGSVWQLHPTEPIWLLGRLFAPSTVSVARQIPSIPPPPLPPIIIIRLLWSMMMVALFVVALWRRIYASLSTIFVRCSSVRIAKTFHGSPALNSRLTLVGAVCCALVKCFLRVL
jgi:hypothetical protein